MSNIDNILAVLDADLSEVTRCGRYSVMFVHESAVYTLFYMNGVLTVSRVYQTEKTRFEMTSTKSEWFYISCAAAKNMAEHD